jgi:hypothetical protein
MNKKLELLLEAELKRFKDISAYQNKLDIKEGYHFYNEADEPGKNQPVNDTPPPVDNSTMPTDDAMPPADDAIPPADDTMPPVDNATPPTGDTMPPADDAMPPADDTMPPTGEMGGDETVEIDITELVNDTKEIMAKVTSFESGMQQISSLMQQVEQLSNNVNKMDSLITKMGELSQQVELMRPPTEQERRNALAKDSYPFNVSVDDYNSGLGAKTQTDLEKNSKMSMFQNIMSDYNDSNVKDSFNVPVDNPFKQF